MATLGAMISTADFERMVHTALSGLLAASGFRLGDASPYRVRYDCDATFVDVDYDASRSRELTIWLGDAARGNEPPLELPDALRATSCGAEAIEQIARSQTEDAAVLAQILTGARDLLAEFGAPFLRGDASAFTTARRVRSQRARTHTAELRDRGVYEAADTAWVDKDYGRVHDLLDPIRDSLDESHTRRLEFAEKRL